MLKQELLKIVDFDYDKKINNIGIYGQNITTKALEIYNEFVKSNKNVVVITQDKAEAEELFSLITTLEKETYIANIENKAVLKSYKRALEMILDDYLCKEKDL